MSDGCVSKDVDEGKAAQLINAYGDDALRESYKNELVELEKGVFKAKVSLTVFSDSKENVERDVYDSIHALLFTEEPKAQPPKKGENK